MPSVVGENTFLTISSLLGHVFSICRRKMYSPKLFEMDIKVLFSTQ